MVCYTVTDSWYVIDLSTELVYFYQKRMIYQKNPYLLTIEKFWWRISVNKETFNNETVYFCWNKTAESFRPTQEPNTEMAFRKTAC